MKSRINTLQFQSRRLTIPALQMELGQHQKRVGRQLRIGDGIVHRLDQRVITYLATTPANH
jgi:hypothetical protein